jgi:hypothetical protein
VARIGMKTGGFAQVTPNRPQVAMRRRRPMLGAGYRMSMPRRWRTAGAGVVDLGYRYNM